MVAAIRQQVTVQPGGLIEVRSPELIPGAQAEVIVLIEAAPATGVAPKRTLSSFFGAAKGLYSSAADADAFIRAERDAWER